MIVLGMDPGRERHGVALVDLAPVRPHLLKSGYLPLREVQAWLLDLPTDGVFAVETSDRLNGNLGHKQAIAVGNNLLRSNKIAKDLILLATTRGRRTQEFSVHAWRRLVARNAEGGVGDKEVHAWLRATTTGLPKGTLSHERDAMGAAIFGGITARLSWQAPSVSP